jgi:hypothetical protein
MFREFRLNLRNFDLLFKFACTMVNELIYLESPNTIIQTEWNEIEEEIRRDRRLYVIDRSLHDTWHILQQQSLQQDMLEPTTAQLEASRRGDE